MAKIGRFDRLAVADWQSEGTASRIIFMAQLSQHKAHTKNTTISVGIEMPTIAESL